MTQVAAVSYAKWRDGPRPTVHAQDRDQPAHSCALEKGPTIMAKVRLSMEVSDDVARLLDDLAEDEDVTRTEIVRRALAVLKAYKDQIDVGRTHIGFTRDADKL